MIRSERDHRLGMEPKPQITKSANLVLYTIVLVRYPDDDPLRIETCRNVQFDIKA